MSNRYNAFAAFSWTPTKQKVDCLVSGTTNNQAVSYISNRFMSCLLFSCFDDLLPRPWSTTSQSLLGVKSSTSFEEQASAAMRGGSPTHLFFAIKKHCWEEVLAYLRSGRWQEPGKFLPGSTGLLGNEAKTMEQSQPQDQCMTWVVDDVGVSRLPLHTAILEEAPALVLKRILGLYPAAIKYRDSTNMLPIQLALTVATSNAALFTLLDAWSPGMNPPVRESRDDRPDHDSWNRRSQGSSRTTSTQRRYRTMFVQQIKYAVKSKNKQDDEWKKVLVNLNLDLDTKSHVKTIIKTLMVDRKRKILQKTRQTAMAVKSSVPKSLWQAPPPPTPPKTLLRGSRQRSTLTSKE
jgi:hypothetical protein